MIYDITTDDMRAATQHDIDWLWTLVQAQGGVIFAVKYERDFNQDAVPTSINTAFDVYEAKRRKAFGVADG